MSDGKAVVGIVLGSASDMAQVEPCVEVLRELDIAYELTVASAHRTPEEATAFARTARERGLKVIIAAAGWAAHLPGVLAAHTTLPIIGLPIGSSPLGGKDALYAMVQMPPGVPVATVGIDTGRNAGILAAQILGTADDTVAQRLASLKEDMAEKVRQAARKLAGGH
ncbi:MAG: 5-(carboxyamino)imidazole ribonucleotide mutase [Armatimonadetes bacterium]|jgi:phosphoribosylaminoimidazole carboxylase PurE protein|nr:5-(carboxyamino)imidazole ribonucleotide mutase [Armatimonadota bacterium]MDI9586940.1 5-(carboxyamino)imidazole ribonucleotide mutase [Acidobacteriota bacterium]